MIKINLLPVEQSKSVEGYGQFVLGLLIVMLVIAGMIAINISQSNKIVEIQRETKRVNDRIKELDAIRLKVEQFKVKNKQLEQRIKVIAELEKNRVGPLYVMDALSTKIPERAWIGSFATRGAYANITGIASSEFVISEFMRSLESSPHFTYVNLQHIKNTNVSGNVFKSFGLGVGVNYFKTPEEASAKQPQQPVDAGVVPSMDPTVVGTAAVQKEGSAIRDGKKVLDQSGANLKNVNQNDSKSGVKEQKDNDSGQTEQKKQEPQKKPTTGVVGSDDGSNVIVF